MDEGVVSWKSVKQILTASSAMEAKYVPCYEVHVMQYGCRTSFHL